MGTWNGGTWHITRISYWQDVMGVNVKIRYYQKVLAGVICKIYKQQKDISSSCLLSNARTELHILSNYATFLNIYFHV